MKTNYVVYNIETGEIDWHTVGDFPTNYYIQVLEKEGQGVALGTGDGPTHYVSNGVILPRPPLNPPDTLVITTDPSSCSTVLGVPEATKVYVNHQYVGDVEDGSFEFSCPVPGNYKVKLEPPFPIQTLTYEVTVNEA